MKSKKVPLMVLPAAVTARISRVFSPLSKKISNFTVGLRYDLEEAGIPLSDKDYVSQALVNSLFFFFIFFFLISYLNRYVRGSTARASLIQGAVYGIVIFSLLFYTLIRYPKIMAGKKAELIDKYLLFALKDLKLQITSGVTLYNGLVNISKAGYGLASIEFGDVARSVNTGTPIEKALEKMAVSSKSEFLRRMTWQLINTLKAGASVEGALSTLIRDLTIDQRDKIKRYSHELNLMVLIYMLFAVAVPTIGATLLVILSSFAGFGITRTFFIIFIVICLMVQTIIIGFVKSRRPVVIV